MKIGLKKLIDGDEYNISFESELYLDQNRITEKVVNPVKIKGTIYANNNDGVLSGELIYIYKDSCARCLKDVSEEIVERIDIPLKRGDNEKSDSLEVSYNEEEIFIEDYITDLIISTSPMKLICSEDCQGICPRCGVNLNEKTCDCVSEDIDPRLAKLKELFD